MQRRKIYSTVLFSLILLVILGCNPAAQGPNNQNTLTPTPQDIPTLTLTSYSIELLSTDTPTPTPTPLVRSYKVTGQEGINVYSGMIYDLENPFTIKANTQYWEMDFELTPTSSQAGTFTMTGTHYEAGPYDGEGTYTIGPMNAGTCQLSLNFTTLIHYLKWPGPVDLLSQGPISYHPILTLLGTPE